MESSQQIVIGARQFRQDRCRSHMLRGITRVSFALLAMAFSVAARGQEFSPLQDATETPQEVVAYPEHNFSYPPGVFSDPHGRVRSPHPLVPPLRCCDDKYRCYTGSAAYCVPVPDVPIPNPEIPTDPITANQQLLTINQAVRIALGNSEVVRNLGLVDAHSDIDIIRGRVTVYDPPAARALADSEWGIFDPLWTTEMNWNKIDVPPGTSFSGIGNRPPQLDTADFITSIEQLLPLGTRFRADYVTDYLFNPDHPPGLDPNPQYFAYQQFGVVQPLMQGLGVNVTMAPIRIAAAEAERTDWRFKQEVLALVRSVETAYWSLYSEQQNLRAIDKAIPLFREIVRVREEQARGPTGTETEVARANSELLLFEQRRLDTLSKIAEQQLVVRDLLGLPPNDGNYLALVAAPITSPPAESVGDAVTTAVNRRPSVLRQRVAVFVAQQERIVAQDSFRPKFDFNAFWRINGLGEDLGESMEVVGQNDFNDWQLGFLLQVPLGRREGRANIRAADYLLQKQRALLDQVAHQTSFEIADAFRRILWLHQMYKVSSSRVEALGKWQEGARAQFENPPPGTSTAVALESYLNNLREYVDASVSSNAILADLNSAYARLEEVKGTLLETRLIEIAGDQTDCIPGELPEPTIIELPDSMVPGASSRERSNEASGTGQLAESAAPVMQVVPGTDLAQLETSRVPPPDSRSAARPSATEPQKLNSSPPVANTLPAQPMPAASVNSKPPTKQVTNWVPKDPPPPTAPAAPAVLGQRPVSKLQEAAPLRYAPAAPATVEKPRPAAPVAEMKLVSPKPAGRDSTQLTARLRRQDALPNRKAAKPGGEPSRLVVLPETRPADRHAIDNQSARNKRGDATTRPERLQPVDLSELYANAPNTTRAIEVPPVPSSQIHSPQIPQTSSGPRPLHINGGPLKGQNKQNPANETKVFQSTGQKSEQHVLSQRSADKPARTFDLSELYADSLTVADSEPLKQNTSQLSSRAAREAQLSRPLISLQQSAAPAEDQRAAPDHEAARARTESAPIGVVPKLARFWTRKDPRAIRASESETMSAGPRLLENPEENYVLGAGGKPSEAHMVIPRSLTNPEAQYVDDVPASFDRKTSTQRLAWAVRILQLPPRERTKDAEENETKPLVNPVGYLLR
jgi:outer membrane protein TolC